MKTYKVGFTGREAMSAFLIVRADNENEAKVAILEYIQSIPNDLKEIEVTTVEELSQNQIDMKFEEVEPSEAALEAAQNKGKLN